MKIKDRLKNAWNTFLLQDNSEYVHSFDIGHSTFHSPNQVRFSFNTERSILVNIINRIAMDVASFDFQHVRLDQNGNFKEIIHDELHNCLTIEANKDQTGRAFIQDLVMSMFDEGVVAIIPVDTSINPLYSDSYKIESLRVGKILEWYPDYIRVELYNDRTGKREKVLLPKRMVGIIENPLYSIVNEPNSTLKRLTRKLHLLDAVDDKTNSGKLDLIIQLPYTVKSEMRQKQANARIAEISRQMERSQYGIAYADATEKITQLNRPVENNLLSQIQYLTTNLYNQLGVTEDIFNGKASEIVMKNYYDRTIEPIVTAIVEELRRKFISKTARTQGQTIMAFRDVFRLVPATELANLADVFSRNEILSANEWRQILGRRPSDNPRADELSNKNMPDRESKSLLSNIFEFEQIDDEDIENEEGEIDEEE